MLANAPRPTVAYAVAADVVVFVRSPGPASTPELERYLEWVTTQTYSAVLIYADGETLTAGQRALMKAYWIAHKIPPTAMLTNSSIFRCAVTAFHWVRASPLRAFARNDHEGALDYLGVVSGSSRFAVTDTLTRLRRAVADPAFRPTQAANHFVGDSLRGP